MNRTRKMCVLAGVASMLAIFAACGSAEEPSADVTVTQALATVTEAPATTDAPTPEPTEAPIPTMEPIDTSNMVKKKRNI